MQLTAYQAAWLRDRSRDKLAVKSRRIGFSEVNALECACDAAGADLISQQAKPPSDQLIGSTGEDQAKDMLERTMRHLHELGTAVTGGPLVADSGVMQIKLSNGRSLRALSSNPAAWRGWEGDVSLDEFAHVPRADEIWKAASKCADRTLARPSGYKRKIFSTPNGDDNKFYRLAETEEGRTFSRHIVTIHDAIAQGFPASWAEICDETPDPDERAQEYECSFLAASLRYIAADAYDECIYDSLPTVVETGELELVPVGAGFDVARKRDNAACVRVARTRDGVLWVLSCDARRDQPWNVLEEWANDAVQGLRGRMAVDATGIGSQFAERLHFQHGSVIIPVTFTLKSKEELVTGLKLGIDRRRVRVPRDPDLRRDVLALRRIVTEAGNVRYDAARGQHGHADRAWALALAIHAAGGATGDSMALSPIASRPRPPMHERANRITLRIGRRLSRDRYLSCL